LFLSSFAPKSKDAANGLNNPDSRESKLVKKAHGHWFLIGSFDKVKFCWV